MTRIDFYLLAGTEEQDSLLFTCRLVEKAFQLGHAVFIHAQNEAQAKTLDELLWSYKEDRFLPHNLRHNKPEGSPIEIGYTEDAGDHHDLLINLADRIPECFGRFARVAEIVVNQESSRLQSRENFRFYRQRGFLLHTHDMRGKALNG